MARPLDWIVASGRAQDGLPETWSGHRVNIDAGVMHTLFVDRTTRRAFALYDGMHTPYTLQHCLNDLIMPRLLASDGHLVLHGSLVSTRAGLIGFIGESGKGKSTLSASLGVRGIPLLTDDVFRLHEVDGLWRAQRLYPGLRLFPDVIEHLFPDADETQPVADYTSKRRLPFATEQEGGALAALFRLGDDVDDICVSRLAPAEACIALISNAFALDPSEAAETRCRFARAAEASTAIPIYDLHYPRNFSRLHCVHDEILAALGLSEVG